MTFPTADRADIALLLEGTFPYVSGGVSSWVNQIIRAFPEYRFAIVFLGSRREDYGDPKYPLPDNVVHFEAHYLYDDLVSRAEPASRPGDGEAYALIKQMHEHFAPDQPVASALQEFRSVARQMLPGGRLTADDFLYSEASWEMICDHYRRFCTDPSFVDYFWTVRIMHTPLWKLARVAKDLLPVRVLHAVSTGYAGFLGALLHQTRDVPLVLSEHGIYTKERKIDLFKSEWIRDNRNVFQRDPTELSYFRQMWIGFFEWLGRFCYDAADPIVALYEANRLRQVADGAPDGRTQNIPNGIALARFAPLRALRPASPPPVLCLIGRVVPIKDVKCFIKGCKLCADQVPNVEFLILGPTDEDKQYFRECESLVEMLGMKDKIKFYGSVNVREYYPKLDVFVLTSISEGQPLTILEAACAGVPTVSTNVGSCSELLLGRTDEDKALGPSGIITNIGQPAETGAALAKLLRDEPLRQQMIQSGFKRIDAYYRQDKVISDYRAIYQRWMSAPDMSEG